VTKNKYVTKKKKKTKQANTFSTCHGQTAVESYIFTRQRFCVRPFITVLYFRSIISKL